jgi:AAA family ATP:ADP antiporter
MNPHPDLGERHDKREGGSTPASGLGENGRAGPLRTLMQMRPGEGGVVLLSALYIFCTLGGYYILRPIRDEISAADRGNLQYLWTAVFLVMLIVVPIYAWLTARWPRRKFVPFVYHFFALNIVAFYVLIVTQPEAVLAHVDRVFYVWVSVFNLFVVSVFWQMMADIYTSEQSKRLFGLIAVGGTLGAIGGSASVALLLDPPEVLAAFHVEHTTLMLISALLLECACICIHLLNRCTSGRHEARDAAPLEGEQNGDAPVRGGVWEGLAVVFRSPYLLLISAFIVLYCMMSTFAYFQQADILKRVFGDDRDAIRSLLAQVDLAVNVLTVVIQCFLAGRIMTRLGVGVALAILPVVAMVGFALLAAGYVVATLPVLAVLVAFQVGRRTANYALAKPARETLFTVVPRDQKYKAKALIDNAVYRGSDTASGWIYTGLQALGLTVAAITLVAVPVAGVWLIISIVLGRMQRRGGRVDEGRITRLS